MEEQKPFHFYLLPKCVVDNTNKDTVIVTESTATESTVTESTTVESTTVESTTVESTTTELTPLAENTIDQPNISNVEPTVVEQLSAPNMTDQPSAPNMTESSNASNAADQPSMSNVADQSSVLNVADQLSVLNMTGETKSPVSIEYFECEYDKETNLLIYPCPHCKLSTTTLVSELACCIFRHGMNKQNQQQIPPHESKERCDAFASNPDYVGCCKPYRIDNINGSYKVSICDYI